MRSSAFRVHGDYAAQPTKLGPQGFSVLTQKDQTPSWELSLPSRVEPTVTKSGEVSFHKKVEGGNLELGVKVARPWAVNATGKRLPTHYEIKDGELVQRVDTSDAQGPIVADPRLTYGWGVYLNLFGTEIKTYASAIVAAGGAGAIATCALDKIPAGLTGLVKLLCTAVGAPTIIGIAGAIVSIWRNSSIDSGACYQKRIVPNVGRANKVKMVGNCVPS